MGAHLTQANKEKDSLEGDGNGVRYGLSSMQGWRMHQEDDHISEPKFNNSDDTSLFAVFDGHGGCEVAKFCSRHFGEEQALNENFKKGKMELALQETFLLMDEILETEFAQKELSTLKQDAGNEDSFFESNAGCTANVILIHQGTIYCANAGDSRSILYSTKMEFETDENITPLSFDHKPENPLEKDRVTKAGGFIIEGIL